MRRELKMLFGVSCGRLEGMLGRFGGLDRSWEFVLGDANTVG